MEPNEFHALAYHQQTETLLKSTFLAERDTIKYYVRLYYYHNFYIEAFFGHRSKLIIHYRAFTHTIFLEPYLIELHLAV